MVIALICVLAALCGISIGISLYCVQRVISLWVDVEAFKKSTHSVQFVGASKEDLNFSDKIEKHEKEYREQAQEAFPEFATFKEDLELKGL